MNLYLSYIGFYAPTLLFLLSLFFLRNRPNYLQFFVIGFIFNYILNIILKLVIKEPRPSTDQKAIEIAVANEKRFSYDKFGMPSGHAQDCGFCLIYITLVLNNPLITTLYIIISIITLFQRYLYNNHTILQLIVGLLVGMGFGYLIYYLTNKLLKGNIKMRKDDNAPI